MKESIQEQLAVARRNQILDAAAKVFAEKGFHSTTSKEIAQEAGIAAGTIYNYFENKSALLLGIFERMRESVLQEVDFTELAAVDIRTFLKMMLEFPLKTLKADKFGLFRVVVSEMMVNEELRGLYYQQILEPTNILAEQYFQQWAEKEMLKPMDTTLIVRSITGMVLGLSMEYILGDEVLASKWDELPDFLATMILDGVRKNLA